jgi:hypothetical protein
MNSTIIKKKQSAIAIIQIVVTQGSAQFLRWKYARTINTQIGRDISKKMRAIPPTIESAVTKSKKAIKANVNINIMPDCLCAIANWSGSISSLIPF